MIVGLVVKQQQHLASNLDGQARKELALQSLNKKQTVVALAEINNVSRQFIHEQKNKLALLDLPWLMKTLYL